jgi:hypothetical protein
VGVEPHRTPAGELSDYKSAGLANAQSRRCCRNTKGDPERQESNLQPPKRGIRLGTRRRVHGPKPLATSALYPLSYAEIVFPRITPMLPLSRGKHHKVVPLLL